MQKGRDEHMFIIILSKKDVQSSSWQDPFLQNLGPTLAKQSKPEPANQGLQDY